MTTIFSHLELETTAPVFPYLLLWVVLCLITKLSSNVTKTHLQSDNLHFLNLKSHNLFHWSKSPSDEINLELCPTVELLITFGKRMSASSQTLQFSNLICTRVLMRDVMKREQKAFRKPVAKWEHFPDQCHWPEFHLQSQKNLEQLLEKPRNPIPGRTSGSSYQVVVSKNGSHEQQAVIRIRSEGSCLLQQNTACNILLALPVVSSTAWAGETTEKSFELHLIDRGKKDCEDHSSFTFWVPQIKHKYISYARWLSLSSPLLWLLLNSKLCFSWKKGKQNLYFSDA